MCGNYQYLITFSFYLLLSFEILITNSKTTTLWTLSSDETRIIEANTLRRVDTDFETPKDADEFDPVFSIITSTVILGKSWVKQKLEYYCTNCQHVKNLNIRNKNNSQSNWDKFESDEILDCGKPVKHTNYDYLMGVLHRNWHANDSEPHALDFARKTDRTSSSIDVDALERKLKRAKKEKPKSVQLYNQIGNFWRIKGDTEKAIQCFRRALAVSPNNAEVLLNLARVLFALNYFDDAIYLTKRSLDTQPPDKEAWQQYFTLAEIMKAYGRHQEAAKYLKRTLKLKPGYEPAEQVLREMEVNLEPQIHIYTLFIIVFLVCLVVYLIFSSYDGKAGACSEIKAQRHFNKAMAMRSLRGFGITKVRNKRVRVIL